MDYQQPNYQPMGQPNQPMEQDSSSVMWYVVSTIVVIIALGLGYFFWMKTAAIDEQTSAIEAAELQQLTEGNTTADISDDLSQIPDLSATLDADAAASAGDIQSL